MREIEERRDEDGGTVQDDRRKLQSGKMEEKNGERKDLREGLSSLIQQDMLIKY